MFPMDRQNERLLLTKDRLTTLLRVFKNFTSNAANRLIWPQLEKQNLGETKDSSTGAYVRHAKYGVGMIIRCEGEGDNSKLTISFPGYGLKKLVPRYAGLEKV